MKIPPKLTVKNVRQFAWNLHNRNKQSEEFMIAKENLYLTADKSKVVDGKSTEQAFLLAAKGSEIPKWAVEKFNLKPGAVSDEGRRTKEAEAADSDGEKASGPKSDKSVKPTENKSVK